MVSKATITSQTTTVRQTSPTTWGKWATSGARPGVLPPPDAGA